MGWCYKVHDSDQTKVDYVRELIRDLIGDSCECTRISIQGNTVYWVARRKSTGVLWIEVTLIAKQRGGGWGYKSMSECAGPYRYGAPLAWLDEVPHADGYTSPEWRDEVRAHHAHAASKRAALRKVKVGQRVRLIPGCSIGGAAIEVVTITSVRPLVGDAREVGSLYPYPVKLRPRLVAEVLT